MKTWPIIIGVLVIVVAIMVFRSGGEDSWIKDDRGVWIKHGNPYNTPKEVTEQQDLISQALELYNKEKNKGTALESQCLGTIQDHAIDIVHVPRSQEDNLEENQCQDYREGRAKHFIELDKEGNIVRIV